MLSIHFVTGGRALRVAVGITMLELVPVNITGDGEEITVIHASDPDNHVFYVTSDGVNISGFTIT